MPPREITSDELHERGNEIMERLDAGEVLIITRDGIPIAELRPLRRRYFVPKEVAFDAFRGAPRIDVAKMRTELDVAVDQKPIPETQMAACDSERILQIAFSDVVVELTAILGRH